MKRSRKQTVLIASRLGLSGESVEQVREAAALHDIGKTGINDAILQKPGKLTREEFETIKNNLGIMYDPAIGEIALSSWEDIVKIVNRED